MSINKYDWNDLYEKAQDYITQIVPDATVTRNIQKTVNRKPRVEFTYPAKGNTEKLEMLKEKQCFRKLKGVIIDGMRMMRGEIIFDENGSIICDFETDMRIPETRKGYEADLLNAFRAGMIAGYGVDHTRITEDENEAIIKYAAENKFKTNAVQEAIKEIK